jgi:hypothetical protein
MITVLVISIVASPFISFDSSNTISNNNEGLRKPGMAKNETTGLTTNQQFK